jgi:hypothetical protein
VPNVTVGVLNLAPAITAMDGQGSEAATSDTIGDFWWVEFLARAPVPIELTADRSYFLVLDLGARTSNVSWSLGPAASSLPSPSSSYLSSVGPMLAKALNGSFISATGGQADHVGRARFLECTALESAVAAPTSTWCAQAAGTTSDETLDVSWIPRNTERGPAAQAFNVTRQVMVSAISVHVLWTTDSPSLTLASGLNSLRVRTVLQAWLLVC